MITQRRSWRGAIVAVGLAAMLAPVVLASDEGQAAAEQVSVSSYQGYMNLSLYTHSGHNRGLNGPQHDPARNNIKALFESYGLPTVLEYFSQGENVVATQTGTLYPNRIYIIGGHYDSVNNPGADDNASGVAAVLEAARVLSQYQTDCTIRYIAFDAEETGLNGSEYHANAHAGEDIRGMISLDMEAYDPGTNHALIYGRTASNPIKNALAAAINEYTYLTYTIQGTLDQSDHAPFEWQGWQACLLIEGEVWNNPYYHTQNDKYESPNYLNFAYAAEMTRATVGWLVDAAGVHVPVNTLEFTYPLGVPEYAYPDGGTVVRVQVAGVGTTVPEPDTGALHYNTGSGWLTLPMTQIADNVYDVLLPTGACGSQVAYYFSAESSEGLVYVHPRGAPANTHAAKVAFGLNTFYANSLDTDPGWTKETLWAFGHPTGGGGEYGPNDPNNGHTGTNVYGYNLNGDYENNLPEKHLTSTAINCTGQYGVHLKFWRWLGVEQPQYDHAYVRVSNNGTTFTTVWQNTSEVGDQSWTEMDLDISSVADNKPSVYLRWTMGTTDSGWRYCGWNVDDVSLTTLVCASPWALGDVNCNGVFGFDDINPFVQILTNPAAWHAAYPDCSIYNADINDDGAVGFGDINPFVALISGG